MKNQKGRMATRTLASCALLAALSVVLARLIIPMPDSSTRFSIEAVPIFIAGMLFGPLAGGLVGFVADATGTLFSPFGFNPIFCLPPVLYGVFGGVFRHFLTKGVNIARLTVSILPPVIFGSVLYQSLTLAIVYPTGTFMQSIAYRLATRSVQFAVTAVLDIVVICFLFQAKIFTRLGLWPPKGRNDKE